MAYNFPVGYQPYYSPQFNQNQMSMPQQAPQQNNNSIIWVQGEAGAKSYMVAPNTTVQLWDSEQQTIYLKSADASGMPSIKTLDYTIRSEAPRNAPEPLKDEKPIEVSKKDIDALQGQIDALKDEFRAYRATVHEITKKKKEVIEDE